MKSFKKFIIENMTSGGGNVFGPNSDTGHHPFSGDFYAPGNSLNLFGTETPKKKKKKKKKFPMFRRNIKNTL